MTSTPTTCALPRSQLTRPDGGAVRVLVVDAEGGVRDLLTLSFRYEGWEVRAVATGAEAVRVAGSYRPDAVLMDRLLPDMDGLQVLHRLRADAPQLPVIFLTARDGVADRLAGLDAGADDYVRKPFSLEEVTARLRGLLRRAGRAVADREPMVLGDLTLDEPTREVTRGGERIHLTKTEFELLRYFMRNPRRVLSKAQILDRVWDYDFSGAYNIVELYVSYLRRKIDKGRAPMIHTVRGVGYVLKPARS